MALYIDKKFVALASPKLEHFSHKSEFLWNFRCPFCLDSKRNKLKCRGYFYRRKTNIFFKCHNCNTSCSLGTFLKDLDPSLFKQYQMEIYSNSKGGNTKSPDFPKELKTAPVFSTTNNFSIPCVKNLSKNHSACLYLIKRRIPERCWDNIYYADDFLKFCDDLFPDHGKKLIKEDSRLVFPFYDTNKTLLGIQGRALPPFQHKIKYITMKSSEDSKKVFGLDTIDFTKTINVVEGPIDSLFLANCVAMMDSALYAAPEIIGTQYDYRFIFDNENRNSQIVKGIGKAIRMKMKVCIFPSTLPKDINDMVLDGHDVNRLIEENTVQGLEAELKFQNWRKV